MNRPQTSLENKLGWRIHEWADAVGISRSQVYNFIRENQIASVKVGASRVITTHPSTFLAGLAKSAA